MKLHLGKMTGQEIAEWLDISYNSTYRKNPQKYISLLNGYCDYIPARGGVIINKIYNDTYIKKGSKLYEQVKDKIDSTWNSNGLDTCSRVGWKIFDELYKDDNKLVPDTVYRYTIKGRNELYGVPNDKDSEGILGTCYQVWCKKDQDTGEYSFLSPEEEKIKAILQLKYFGNAQDREDVVDEMIEQGIIKEEDAWRTLKGMEAGDKKEKYFDFISEFQEQIGSQVARATYIQRKSAWEIEEGKKFEF